MRQINTEKRDTKKVYAMAYREINEILKYIPQEEYRKLPKKLLDTIQNHMDQEYHFEINKKVGLEKQKLLDETRLLLAVIFRDYLADETERKVILQKEQEEKKRKKQKLDFVENTESMGDKREQLQKSSIEGKKDKVTQVNLEEMKKKNTAQVSLSRCQKSVWYIKFWNLLKKIFR